MIKLTIVAGEWPNFMKIAPIIYTLNIVNRAQPPLR